MIHVSNILYATDFSAYSNQAYFHAVALAEKYGAHLRIVYVHAPDDSTEADSEAARRHWRGQLEQIRPLNSNIPVEHVFLEGDPADELIRYATDARIDLIVMGTHGRSGLERLLMGSVAEEVLRGAPCSVLVVKMPKQAAVTETSGQEQASI